MCFYQGQKDIIDTVQEKKDGLFYICFLSILIFVSFLTSSANIYYFLVKAKMYSCSKSNSLLPSGYLPNGDIKKLKKKDGKCQYKRTIKVDHLISSTLSEEI